ncbi:uncharacterized protein C2845_PM05G08430 [Panicum miliaceum]|uniref:Ribosome biogenesis protein slx9-like n=1 Tax=Panicum miliaceum TaxID=4540 RepID=A0A3L6SZ66_PANMI|nr:uncharacterized protein C2845_PM05G08430 [Panicum miliaceum]
MWLLRTGPPYSEAPHAWLPNGSNTLIANDEGTALGPGPIEFEVKDTVTSLNAKKTISKKKNQSRRQKKLKAYDLSALSEFLPEPAEPEHKTEGKLNCKSRQTLVLRESAHLKAVLNNPQFQLDPFAAIHQHLLATQPPEAAKKDDATTKHGKDSKDKKRRRKKKSASSSTQAMDI